MDHLQDNQWAKSELPLDPRITYGDNPLSQVAEIDCEDCTIEEFNAAIESSKPNKTPGPDQIPAGHWKVLDIDNRTHILDAINSFANTGILPETLNLANVVLIHKRANLTSHGTTDPSLC